MEKNGEAWAALAKGAISWLLVVLGSMTAAKVATYLAIAYTSVQLYVTVRDKLFRGGHS